jgi:hypothetical protein
MTEDATIRIDLNSAELVHMYSTRNAPSEGTAPEL